MLREADQESTARLLATAQKESRLGSMDSESFRVTIALWVSTDVCISYSCRSEAYPGIF